MSHSTGPVCGPRSQAAVVRPPRELREPSLEGAQSSRVRRRLRGERGQAAVEFAMVVPLLCLIIIGILHFGKVMNYWLDLNHVASEGARKAAVNAYASDGEYGSYVIEPAGDGRASRRRDHVDPLAEHDQRLPAGRRRRRRPRDGAGRRRLQPARSSATTITLRGKATMRMEQPADFAGAGTCA